MFSHTMANRAALSRLRAVKTAATRAPSPLRGLQIQRIPPLLTKERQGRKACGGTGGEVFLAFMLGLLLTAPSIPAVASRLSESGGNLLPSLRGVDLEHVRFLVVDPVTHQPVAGALVRVEDPSGLHAARALSTGLLTASPTAELDLRTWACEETPLPGETPVLVTVPLGATVTLQATTTPQAQPQPPVREIYVKVTATRLIPQHANPIAPGTTVNRQQIENKAGVGGNLNKVISGTTGAASDSAGQVHVRGEHADISYVVDGVPLPDTLSGRQGSVVVPSTIQRLEILTGGFAPEFGGQTAAILNVITLPVPRRRSNDLAGEIGAYDTSSGDFTAVGPVGTRLGYVFDLGATRTRNYIEPQQPGDQTAHNSGVTENYFSKLRYEPSHRDVLQLTLSSNPDAFQVSNRTGLPASFAAAGQGFGFLGLRDANGVIPDTNQINPGGLGSEVIPLPSQEAEGQDIYIREANEFGTLSWQRQLSASTSGLLALTLLHAGQDVHNHNPAVDLLHLPIDNSIEYNPTAARNIHHVQETGSLTYTRGRHEVKTGFLLDDQFGNESYNITPASQLALDELAALDSRLVPAGSVQMNAQGKPVLDVNGNPVYIPTSGVTPTLSVHRSGFYRAAYLQDTWHASHRLTVNYGLRFDWYKQSLNLGQPVVDVKVISPRLNFSYNLDRLTVLRWSYNHLLNTPPLAQGAIVGSPIQPEILDQYDVSMERQIAPSQTIDIAYYVKQMHNQVDTGLLVPGSWIGLYSAVNFEIGAVHGIEFAYEVTPRRGVGWDADLNYTYSIAAPNGMDNTGAPAPDFNDHDQRNTVGMDLNYDFKGGGLAGLTLYHGSGLASSIVPPGDKRTPNTRVDLNFETGPRLFHGHAGLGLSILNVFDARDVLNFLSGFSGTRFMQGRRVLFSLTGSF